MPTRTLPILVSLLVLLLPGQVALAQDALNCDDITWSSAVTSQYPNIDKACNGVVQKNGETYARISVELRRVSGNSLTFKVLNRDGTSGGTYTQVVQNSWRATIGGEQYRARDLKRGQRLNVYLPPDRWAVIHEDDDGPDMEDAIVMTVAPVLPKTASQLPLIGAAGLGLLLLGGGFTLLRRRLTARV